MTVWTEEAVAPETWDALLDAAPDAYVDNHYWIGGYVANEQWSETAPQGTAWQLL